MNRIISICLAVAMMFCMAACGSAATTETTAANEVVQAEETKPSQEAEVMDNATDAPQDSDVLSEAQADAGSAESGSKILVAYFSLADEQYEVGVIEKGNTEIIAEMIAEATGADTFKIERTTPYPTTYDELLDESRREDDAPPEIVGTVDNMDAYDTVFIGYPIWWGDLPGIVTVFLSSYDFSGKTLIPFCTHAGSGLSGTPGSVENQCPGAAIHDGLAVHGRDAQNDPDGAREQVTQWLTELGYVS